MWKCFPGKGFAVLGLVFANVFVLYWLLTFWIRCWFSNSFASGICRRKIFLTAYLQCFLLSCYPARTFICLTCPFLTWSLDSPLCVYTISRVFHFFKMVFCTKCIVCTCAKYRNPSEVYICHWQTFTYYDMILVLVVCGPPIFIGKICPFPLVMAPKLW